MRLTLLVVVPLLPTIDFMLLAAPCFARSSPRLEVWLLNHPRSGSGIRAWRAEGAVPHHVKIVACIGMTLGYLLFWWFVHPGPIEAIAVTAIMIASGTWVVSRPVPGQNQ